MSKKIDWAKIQEYQNDNKELMIMVADPQSDSISISFGGFNTFVRFPMKDLADGVVFNALRESSFKGAIEPFMEGVVKSTGITPKNKGGNELLKVLGGAMQGLGAAKAKEVRSNLADFYKDDNKNGKTKKGK